MQAHRQFSLSKIMMPPLRLVAAMVSGGGGMWQDLGFFRIVKILRFVQGISQRNQE
jgi:hypothetical protein